MLTVNTSSLSDREVIAESRRDPARFAEIFDRYWPAVHRYCVRRAGADGEDIAAETFRTALSSIRRFDRSRQDAGPWLFGIATNLMRARHRAHARRARALLRLTVEFEVDPAESVLDRVEAQTLGPRVAEALGRLPAASRDALLLHVWADLSYEQIAEATSVPIGTVRSRISRARGAVRLAISSEKATTSHDSPRS